MKAITSLFGLIPTKDVESNGANEFVNGVFRGMINVENMKDFKELITEDRIKQW